jgi:hypothetical protein
MKETQSKRREVSDEKIPSKSHLLSTLQQLVYYHQLNRFWVGGGTPPIFPVLASPNPNISL